MGLLLTRKVDEKIVITIPAGFTIPAEGLRIVVTTREARPHHCRLDFEAPDFVVIHRGEIQEQVDAGVVRSLRKGSSSSAPATSSPPPFRPVPRRQEPRS